MGKIKLDDIKNKHPFSVPDGYFEQLSANVLERKSAPRPQTSWVWTPGLKLATATSFVVVIVMTFVISLSNQEDIYDKYLADVSNEDIMAYLAETDMTELDLLDMVNENYTIEFDIETETLDDIDLGDESLDELYLEYGIDELNEI